MKWLEALRAMPVAAMLACGVAMAANDDRVVPANEEPRHVVKLENEWVRVIDVEIPEGEQTLYHAHSLDYPYVLVASVTLYNQIYGQEPKDVKMEAGSIGYYRASTQGTYTHRFINRGPGTFRAIGIELLKPLQPPVSVVEPMPASSGLETVLDNERVRAYRVRLAPGQSVGPVTIAGPSIRVAMGQGRIAEKVEGRYDAQFDLAPAQFVFRPQATTTTITNNGTTPVELVEFVLK
ncbi:MAG: hypothetical protein AABM64_07385 [Pseudomonadota bacterium]